MQTILLNLMKELVLDWPEGETSNLQSCLKCILLQLRQQELFCCLAHFRSLLLSPPEESTMHINTDREDPCCSNHVIHHTSIC